MMTFEEIFSNFPISGKLISCEPYGSGHINRTYKATFTDGTKKTNYILQKINSTLFTNVDALMNNISLVTEYNRKKIIENGGDPNRESLTIIKTVDGKNYFKTPDDEYYRVYIFIEDAIGYDRVEKPEHFYESAVAFGKFAKLLDSFDSSKLYEVLPNFHNTVKRFQDFKTAVAEDKAGRAKLVQKEIEFALNQEKYTSRIVDLLNKGEIPSRVTHNDTKLNNVLIDVNTDKAICVIDLDTMMPGSILYDFGDSIRFGCNRQAEDTPDTASVVFDLPLFEEYTKGYLSVFGDAITKTEKDNLPMGAMLMTYECGIRFLGDYLNGDVYFRSSRENQNLDRARTQFKLVSDMQTVFDKMCNIVNKY